MRVWFLEAPPLRRLSASGALVKDLPPPKGAFKRVVDFNVAVNPIIHTVANGIKDAEPRLTLWEGRRRDALKYGSSGADLIVQPHDRRRQGGRVDFSAPSRADDDFLGVVAQREPDPRICLSEEVSLEQTAHDPLCARAGKPSHNGAKEDMRGFGGSLDRAGDAPVKLDLQKPTWAEEELATDHSPYFGESVRHLSGTVPHWTTP
jgi:hypothetical protein